MKDDGDGGIFISGGNISAGSLAIGRGARSVQQVAAPSVAPAVSIRRDVFLSYRRRDSKAYAGRLRDALKPCLQAPAQLFMDIDSIGGGVDFAKAIEAAVSSSAVVLVLIGPVWLTIADEQGAPRLCLADDLVRREVRLALEAERTVIPVLVDGARMPTVNQLPPPLSDLAGRNAVELSDTRWDYDVQRLLASIAEAGS